MVSMGGRLNCCYVHSNYCYVRWTNCGIYREILCCLMVNVSRNCSLRCSRRFYAISFPRLMEILACGIMSYCRVSSALIVTSLKPDNPNHDVTECDVSRRSLPAEVQSFPGSGQRLHLTAVYPHQCSSDRASMKFTGSYVINICG